MNIDVLVANEGHKKYIPDILSAIFEASKVKGNSIVMRDPDYLAQKMREGKAVIALCGEKFVGFCYLECWQNEQFVANSGLIVRPEFRGQGVASRIKRAIFQQCRSLFPNAYIFSITKSEAVIRMNTALGFERVDYDQLTNDPKFWKGCDTCPNYPVLLANEGISCHCVGLLYRPHQIFSKPFDQLTPDQLYKILQLRERVFVLEQECLYQDMDDIDYMACHTFCMEGNKILAYARTFWKDETTKVAQIGRVVTDPEARRKKKASIVMKECIRIAKSEMNAERIYLEAQTYAIPFYEQLGFHVASEVFLEDGIPHVQMFYEVCH